MSSRKSIIKSMGWDAAIEDANRHIERLKTVVRICEQKKAAGEPWPGSMEAVKAEASQAETVTK